MYLEFKEFKFNPNCALRTQRGGFKFGPQVPIPGNQTQPHLWGSSNKTRNFLSLSPIFIKQTIPVFSCIVPYFLNYYHMHWKLKKKSLIFKKYIMMPNNHQMKKVLFTCFYISNMHPHPLHVLIVYSPNYFNNSGILKLSL